MSLTKYRSRMRVQLVQQQQWRGSTVQLLCLAVLLMLFKKL